MSQKSSFRVVLKRIMNRALGSDWEDSAPSRIGRDVTIGEGSTIGWGTVLRDDITIGKRTRIGDLCVLEGATTIGDSTDIESQSHITRFSSIGNHVFIGPCFISTNDTKMTYHRKGHGENLKGVRIEDFVRIGGGAMTLPGITIGEGAVVGAFSLVTRDVEPYTLVYGVPAAKHEDKSGILKERVLPQFK